MTDKDERAIGGAWSDGFDLRPRDHVFHLIGGSDLDAQLTAIKIVLRRNYEAEKQAFLDIKELNAQLNTYSGNSESRQRIEDQRIDILHGSVFQDAAHSMSAVGMLAPFIESLLVSIFQGLREHYIAIKCSFLETHRGPSSIAKFWDPRRVYCNSAWSPGIVRGTEQLSDVIGLSPYLPEGFAATHAALTAYRNSMFHNGFEWPLHERRRFAELIKSEDWPEEWFNRSTSDDEPWIFYMSGRFIDHCLEVIDQVMDGVGRYFEQRVSR